MTGSAHASTVVSAPADAVFATLTDIARDLRPVTFWRRVLLAHIRARQLARTEVPASLAALARAASVSQATEA